MKRTLVAIAVLLFVITATAQKHPDPLNQLEIDRLRDTAQDPLERLKLYVNLRVPGCRHWTRPEAILR